MCNLTTFFLRNFSGVLHDLLPRNSTKFTGKHLCQSLFFNKVACFLATSEAVVQRCFVKKVFLEIPQNSQGNICASSFLIKLQVYQKKRLWNRCFPVNFVKFQKTSFFIEHLWWLLLQLPLTGKVSTLVITNQ